MNKLILISLSLPAIVFGASDITTKPNTHLLELAQGQRQQEIFDQILAHTRNLRALNCVGNRRLKDIIAKYKMSESALTAHKWEENKDKIKVVFQSNINGRFLSHDKTKLIEFTDNTFQITNLATLEKISGEFEEYEIINIKNSNLDDIIIVELGDDESGDSIIQLIDLNEYITYRKISYAPIKLGQSFDSQIFVSQDKNSIIECDYEYKIFKSYSSQSGKSVRIINEQPGFLNFVYNNKLIILGINNIFDNYKLVIIDINSEERQSLELWNRSLDDISMAKLGHSKDGKIIFYMNSNGKINIFNYEKLTSYKLDSYDTSYKSIIISDDNKYIIGMSTDNLIVWSIESGNIISVIQYPNKITERVSPIINISSDGSMIAIGRYIDNNSGKYLVELYNVDQSCYMYAFEFRSGCAEMLISGDGKSIYYGPQTTFMI